MQNSKADIMRTHQLIRAPNIFFVNNHYGSFTFYVLADDIGLKHRFDDENEFNNWDCIVFENQLNRQKVKFIHILSLRGRAVFKNEENGWYFIIFNTFSSIDTIEFCLLREYQISQLKLKSTWNY